MAFRMFYGPEVTFNDVPRADMEDPSTLENAAVTIIGAPFDGGLISALTGTRNGPRAIRTNYTFSMYHLKLGVRPLEDLRVVDVGDVHMPPGDILKSLNNLQRAVATVAKAGPIPLILGGDHSIMWPDVAGVAEKYGNGRISVIHFDSHADSSEISDTGYDFYTYCHGTMVSRLIRDGVIRGDRFIQIGLRGYYPDEATLKWMDDQGMHRYIMDDVDEMGLDRCLDEAFRIATDGCEGVFLSIDIDVVDPLLAPGNGSPEPGGFSSREIIHAVRRCCLELPVVGLDLVEVSPLQDVQNVTALLANRILLDALSGIAKRRQIAAAEVGGKQEAPNG